MTNTIRRQLTLFVEQKDATTIERVRQEYNPRQFNLIKSHVTLCREDEIQNIEQVKTNLSLLTQIKILIEFGEVTRFDNGKGLLLPATKENTEFQELRKQILVGPTDSPRNQDPHITLMHPRNSNCTDTIFEHIKTIDLPTKLEFKKISLIEQIDSGRWNIIQESKLKDKI